MSTISFADAVVLVTGASGALGSRIARLLADQGARLVLVGRNLNALMERAPAGATVISADLTQRGEAERVVAAAVAAHGALDGVVNALGVVAFGPLATMPDDVMEMLVQTNLLAPLRVIRAAIPHLAASNRATFVANLSAVVAENPVAGMTTYSATKAALTGADRALTRELRREKIHVLDVRPPHTETGLAGRAIDGVAPTLPPGLDPDAVAARIVAAISAGERELASDQFDA
jgi:short-subunit dehydrogenase